MNKTICKIIVTLVSVLFTVGGISQEKFKIERENETSKHEFGINKFSFIHQVCPDSFFMTELYHQLTYDDMVSILKPIYDGVTLKDMVSVHFEKVRPTTAKLVYFIKEHEKNGRMFIMLTNFSNATRQFEKKPDSKDQLARWYFMKGDRFVYRKDLYTKEKEDVKFQSDKPQDIIKYYLFDDNTENDELVKPLLDKLLGSKESDVNKFFGYILLVQYYLMNNQMEQAKDAMDRLESYFNGSESIPRNNTIYFKMVKAEYEVMKRL